MATMTPFPVMPALWKLSAFENAIPSLSMAELIVVLPRSITTASVNTGISGNGVLPVVLLCSTIVALVGEVLPVGFPQVILTEQP